ncbi:MAG: alkaline phosphatase D family protein [Pseudomonadales bacterium]|nr:alkaline phosphatase D family protein [Pseudomonadales bacterium]
MNSNFTRRRFLKTVVVSAGAVGAGGLIGCGSESSSHSAGVSFSSVDEGTIFPQSVASGDPKAGSIILWTRLGTSSTSGQSVTVQVASDPSFSGIVAQTSLTSSSSSDHCLKVKVTELNAATTYYYRFITSDTSSRTGRFKTAAKGNVDTPVKFGFISCQDYVNGYYNTLLKFLEQDQLDSVDFIVHLGDYIYETTGDPSFQANVRSITFTDQDGALPLPNAASPTHYAAQSLSNYRQLYKTYRSDAILQQVHENFAFINIWDDHEFSDDSWQDNATYNDGASDEQSTSRKESSEQAFFEYTPIDIVPNTGGPEASGQISVDADNLYQSIISRQFRFGSNLNLMMSGFRTFRPDHVIPEDSYPGKVILPELELGYTLITSFLAGALTACTTQPPAVPGADFIYNTVAALVGPIITNPAFDPANPFALMIPADIQSMVHDTLGPNLINSLVQQYVDIEDPAFAVYKAVMQGVVRQQYVLAGVPDTTAAETLALDERVALRVSGRMAVDFINGTVAAAGTPVPLLGADPDREYGMTYALLGRDQSSVISSNGIGSRYNVVKDTYDIYTLYLSSVAPALHPLTADPDYIDPNYDNAWGDAQQTSILINLKVSNATWNVLGSSTSFTSMVLNAGTDLCTGLGSALRQELDGEGLGAAFPQAQIYLNVDQWDGFPVRRRILMDDPTGAIAANGLKTLKGADTIIISGDIHATFATDHGANASGNRAIEFTTPGVSSGNFATFVTGAISGTVGGLDAAENLTSKLDIYMEEGNPLITHNNNAVNGVAIVSITSTTLTTTFHHLATGITPGFIAAQDPASLFYTNLVTSYYDSSATAYNPDQTALAWTSQSFSVTKVDGKNGALTEL